MTTDYRWITRPEELQSLAPALERARWIALDTESNSMFAYRERVCLIQLNVEGALYLLDPFSLGEAPRPHAPSPAMDVLKPAFANPGIPKLLHGGEYDVATLQRDFDLQLAGIFDSQQAASLLGWERTGYGAIVERVLGIALAKEHATYDWSRRPIDPDAVEYAVDDVRYLPQLWEHLKSEAARADIEEELDLALRDVEAHRPWNGGFDPAAIWRMPGALKLGERAMNVLFALHCRRDELARGLDRPSGQLINDRALVALAMARPRTLPELKRHGIRASLASLHGAELLDLIRRSESHPERPLPDPPTHQEPDDAEKKREAKLREWRQKESRRRQVNIQVVLPSRALKWLKAHGAADLKAVPMLGDKRIRLYGEQLERLCRT